MQLTFSKNGNLVPGIHVLDWTEFVRIFGHTQHRTTLLIGMRAALASLRRAGCQAVFIDGSFVTEKERVLGLPPADYDGCWDLRGVDPTALDPILLDFANGRAAQKAKFLGELFPAQFSSGAQAATFLEFFQQDKTTGEPKGIVSLSMNSLP